MPATTFEQLIANHGDMIARHEMRDTLGTVYISDFIAILADLGRLYSTGATSALQDASDNLTAAASYLTDAEHDTTAAPVLIAKADKHLHHVDALALA
jgi:hypothetical protein